MKLYEIAEEDEKLMKFMIERADIDTGELSEEVLEELQAKEEEVAKNLFNKTGNIIKYIKNLESDLKTIEIERKRLQKKEKSLKEAKENIRNYLKFNMIRMNKEKLESPFGKIGLAKKEKMLFADDCKIPKKYVKMVQPPKVKEIDRKAIEELIRSGNEKAIENLRKRGITLIDEKMIKFY